MAGIRMTGLTSGLDTESLVQQLSKAYQTKIDNVTKEKTKVEWKKEAWKSLNTKIMDFYKGALSTFRSVSTYRTKSATGNLTGVKVTASSSAVNGTHKVQVLSTATAQMWTGRKLTGSTYTATSYKAASDTSMKLSDLKDNKGDSLESTIRNAEFKVTKTLDDGTTEEVTIRAGYDANGNALASDASVQNVLDNMNAQLTGAGIEMEASFVNGNFRLSNVSADEVTTETVGEDGTTTTTTTYENGVSYKVAAVADADATVFGVTTDGVTMNAKGSEDGSTTVGGSQKFYEEVETENSAVKGSTKLIDLGIAEGTKIKINGNAVTIDRTTTLSSLGTQLSKLGIEANYDATQGRFYLNSKGVGEANAFTVEAENADGTASDALSALGLDLAEGEEGRIDATDAIIRYNGVEYKQSSSSFSINGITIEATEEGEEQSFTVGIDAQGIYDKVKDFVNSYNELIEEMNTLYDAERVTDYEPLTEDEKAGMSDDEIEKWEGVIKASLLRRDDTISSLLSSMRSILNGQISVTNSDGSTKNYSLASFGINTGIYSEKGQLHIYGNDDDADYADYDDSLMKAIMNNPEAVEKTLSGLGSKVYESLQKAMAKTELSSALTFYNDKYIDEELEDYKDKISDLEDELVEEEDRYYEQFSAMETAMAKLQAQQSYISQLFA